ncbi:MAG: transposase [Saprospiraceae bacterium]|nr:transposase [Candidatus Vicinibacter affinis]
MCKPWKQKKTNHRNFIKEIHRRTRRTFSSEQKITIVMEALRQRHSSRTLSKYSIQEPQFYKWNKEFLEAGKKRLSGEYNQGKLQVMK